MNEPQWDEDEQRRRRAFVETMTTPRDAHVEGSRRDVNELNRRNRELLAANVRLQEENQALRRRLGAPGETV